MGANFDPEIVTFLMEWSPGTSAVTDEDLQLHFHEHAYRVLLCEKKFSDYAEGKSFLALQSKLLTLHQ